QWAHFRKIVLDGFVAQAAKTNAREVVKNRRSPRCLLINCHSRTNFVGSSAQAPKHPGSVTQVCRLTDNLISQCDQRVGREHDCIWTRLRNGHSFSDGVPQREFAQCQASIELFCNTRLGDFKMKSTLG